MGIPRVAAGAFLSLALALGAPAFAADDLAPAKAFLERLYAGYGKSDGPGPDLRNGKILVRSLEDLWDRAEKAEEGPVIDADPVCACQDYTITDVSIDVRQGAEPGSAKATAAFKNFGKPVRVGFDLVRTPAGWRIVDIHDKGVASLRKQLEEAIAPTKTR